MKIVFFLFCTFPIFGQYSEWAFEPKDSLYSQYNQVWSEWDYWRESKNYTPALVAKFQELGEWCAYKIACYTDSVQVEYNVFTSNGKKHYGPIDAVDPGFYHGYMGRVTVTERKTPTFEGFMQYKLANMKKVYIFTPHVKID